MLFVVLCPGAPEGSTGSGSGFKASQKTGQRLKKVSSDRLGEHLIFVYQLDSKHAKPNIGKHIEDQHYFNHTIS